MDALLLGVRGSTPAPGPEFVRYGGHTSCVALVAGGDKLPTLVLDAGTGLRGLTSLLNGAYRGTIALSHLHWDHMQGLPFFAAGDRPDARVELLLPGQLGRNGRDLLAQALSPPAFPITPEELQGQWTFTALEPGVHQVGPMRLISAEITHKGGRTFGYRVQDVDGGSLAYLPDHAPAAGITDGARALCQGADVLLHDAQFLDQERPVAHLFGHATVQDAIALAAQSGVGELVLFHHGPARTDDALDAQDTQAKQWGAEAGVRVRTAREGDRLAVATREPAAGV